MKWNEIKNNYNNSLIWIAKMFKGSKSCKWVIKINLKFTDYIKHWINNE